MGSMTPNTTPCHNIAEATTADCSGGAVGWHRSRRAGNKQLQQQRAPYQQQRGRAMAGSKVSHLTRTYVSKDKYLGTDLALTTLMRSKVIIIDVQLSLRFVTRSTSIFRALPPLKGPRSARTRFPIQSAAGRAPAPG
eukprot:4589772-Pleurochrysis_carterae.AAC.4